MAERKNKAGADVVISLAERRAGKGTPPARDDVLNALGGAAVTKVRKPAKPRKPEKAVEKPRVRELSLKVPAAVRRDFKHAARAMGEGKGAFLERLLTEWLAREAQDKDV